MEGGAGVEFHNDTINELPIFGETYTSFGANCNLFRAREMNESEQLPAAPDLPIILSTLEELTKKDILF